MKTFKFIAVLLLVFSLTTSKSQQVIVVTDSIGGNVRVYDIIDSAIKYCNKSDFVYLPGGSFNISSLRIAKKIHIIGAGYRTDSSRATGITALSGNLYLLTGADGGSISGVSISGAIVFGTGPTDQTINGYTISRCYANNTQLAYQNHLNSGSKNVNITECVFGGPWVYFGYTTNLNISKCIFNGRIHYANSAVQINNCIFLFRNSGWPVLNDMTNCMFYNNIFLQEVNICYSGYPNTFTNNIFATGTGAAQLSGMTLANNVYNFSIDSMFTGATSADFYYSEARNYHLKQPAIAALRGTDNTDVGIYGTAYPFKAGGITQAPHILFKSIAPSTDPSGKIRVNIKVQAQDW